jgi:quercetin dioxygenase-like cupin family protein
MRRVVTETHPDGYSTITSSGEPPSVTLSVPAVVVTELWASDEVPPPVDGPDLTVGDKSVAIEMAPGAFRCRLVQLPPVPPGEPPFFHRTPTLDVVLVLSGAVSLLLEDGTATRLKAGDSIVQRETAHAWRTEGDEPCTLASFTVGLGAGRGTQHT